MSQERIEDTASQAAMADNGQFASGMTALSKCLKAAFAIMAILIVGMLVWFFTFGGFFVVSPQESVIVLRFGKYFNTYDESWHWVFPYPVNTIIRVPKSTQSIKTSSFMPENRSLIVDRNPEAMMAAMNMDGEGGTLVPGKDGYLLTGDTNIIHTEWETTYSISDPKTYFETCLTPLNPSDPDDFLYGPAGERLGTRGPKTLLKTLLDNAVVKVTAEWSAENALYSKRDSQGRDYVKQVEDTFRKTIGDMDIGIRVDNVSVRVKSPPPQTVPAFEDVIAAEQQSDSELQKARAYAVEQANLAESERVRMVAEAEAYKKMTIADVSSERDYFLKLQERYAESPDSTLTALYSAALADSLDKVKDKFIITRTGRDNQEIRLKLTPEIVRKRPDKPDEGKEAGR